MSGAQTRYQLRMRLVETGSVRLADISTTSRLRPVNEDWAVTLAHSIRSSDLQNPVSVHRDGKKLVLITGAHRKRAYELLSAQDEAFADIPARVLEAVPAKEGEAGFTLAQVLRFEELSENVFRHELNALDRAAHIHEMREIVRLEIGETRGGDRTKGKTANISVLLSDEVADRVGMGERSMRSYAAIHAGLPAELREMIKGTDLASNRAELAALASEKSETKQRRALNALLNGKAKNVKHALAVINGVKVDTSPTGIAASRLMNAWGVANLDARVDFLRQLVAQGVIDKFNQKAPAMKKQGRLEHE